MEQFKIDIFNRENVDKSFEFITLNKLDSDWVISLLIQLKSNITHQKHPNTEGYGISHHQEEDNRIG